MNETHVLIMGANSSLIRLVELLRQRQYKITIVSKQLPEDTAAFHDCTLIRNDFLAKSSLDQLPTNDIEIAICLAEHHEKDSKEADARSTLAAMSIKSANSNIRTIVELQNPSSPKHINMDHVDELIPADAFITEVFALSTINAEINSYRQLILDFAHDHDIQLGHVSLDYLGSKFEDFQAVMLEKNKFVIGLRRSPEPGLTEDIVDPNSEITPFDRMIFFDLSDL